MKYTIDSSLNLEKISLLRKIIDVFWIPLLNSLPGGFGERLFEKSSTDGKKVKEYATTFKALEIFYEFDGKIHFKKYIKNPFLKFLDGIFTWVWHHIHNVKAVRNRLKIVAREIKLATKYFLETGEREISILSLGAGSARAPYEAMQGFNNKKDIFKIDAVLVDKNQEALDYSEYLSKKYNLPTNIFFSRIKCNISEFPTLYNKNLNIVEAVGLFDYFNDEKCIEKFKLIYDRLKENGYFIVSNIMPNREKPFVEKIIKWRGMHYRKTEDFVNLLIKAGFKEKSIKILIEPQRIYTIAVAQKI